MAAIIPIRAFSDNYIWAIREGRHAVVVDPGDDEPVERWLAREGVTLGAILVTHHHGDHTGGVAALCARRAIPVFGPAREAIPGRTRALSEGDAVELEHPSLRLRVLDVPGHTSGHIAYVGEIDRAPVAFVGDTLFAGGCGRLFEGTPAQMAASLAKLASLPGETRVYCAHEYTLANLRFARAVEPDNEALVARVARDEARRGRDAPTVPSTIADERATNPFLRAGEPAVFAAAQRHAGRAVADPVDAFAVLREWKNTF
jgi:hydroxyacylglutathione hydrolase